MHRTLIALAIALPFICNAQKTAPALQEEPNQDLFGARIQRTMTLLKTSSEKQKHTVKILFYGQSIVAGLPWKQIIDELKSRYPNANIISENRAIGGYTAPVLIRTAANDLYPYYPDLTIFHVYTATSGEWERIIRNIRKRTTSEIMIFTHQLAYGGRNHEKRTVNDDIDSQAIRFIAQKYNCEIVEVRKEWKQYLKQNNIPPNELMGNGKDPNVHPNAKGKQLLIKMLMRHLRYNTLFPGGWYNTVKKYDAREAVEEEESEITFTGKAWRKHWQNYIYGEDPSSALKLKFTGNRIDVTAPNLKKYGTARILIDGKKPSSFRGVYSCTRASKLPNNRPAINRTLPGKNPAEENWTLKITKIDDSDPTWRYFEYEVIGSKTGKDGKGNSKEKFHSKSGRIIIDPQDFFYGVRRKSIPCPDKITWKVECMALDTWQPSANKDKAIANTYTLAQGLPNTEHTIEIIPNGNGPVPVKSLTVYTPPLK